MTDSFMILKHPLSTEKSIRLMESENKLVFMVERRANKEEIKTAFEEMFKIKPVKVNTLITSKGTKKAIIKLPMDKPAIDVATKLGIM
ncbi:50S ribosomal protein L23 [Candidatus Woesearchaeota archaeon]|nr:50S ribosomal protein L23 [Candidatus Woesearchaeota archaeon]